MIAAGPDEKIYPVVKIAMIMNALCAEGISSDDALRGVHLSNVEMQSAATRVSLNQIIEYYRNAARLSRNPHFAYALPERAIGKHQGGAKFDFPLEARGTSRIDK